MSRSAESSVQSATVGGVYACYVLAVLFLVYVLNFVDRQILSILVQDIKTALKVGDAEMGFLYGTAFAVFYALFGIPLGRLADSWHRGRQIALGLALWSAMTTLSGLASSFSQLAAARIGVGIGEASASPAAYSLLADYFSRERRATVLAIYSAGLYVGGGLSLPIGGAISRTWTAHYQGSVAPFGLAGWQAAFIAVGIPGLLLALWVLTLREPPRGLADGTSTGGRRQDAWREFTAEVMAILPPFTLLTAARIPGGLRRNVLLLGVVAIGVAIIGRLSGDWLQWTTVGVGTYATGSWIQQLRHRDRPTYTLLWGTPATLLALLSCGFMAFVIYALAYWAPPFAMRTFHIAADVAGLMIGVPCAFAMAAGCILGGRLSDAWKKRDPRGRVFVSMLTMVLPPPLAYLQLSTNDVHVFYVLAPVTVTLASLWVGSSAAMIQDCVLPRMRGTAGATFLLANSMLGLALSPYLVGRVSVATGSLRTGLLSLFIVVPFALYVMWQLSLRLPTAEASRETRALGAGESPASGMAS